VKKLKVAGMRSIGVRGNRRQEEEEDTRRSGLKKKQFHIIRFVLDEKRR
jgi:hypothetical protein